MHLHKKGLTYRHVDVFSNTPLSGNGLIVFISDGELSRRSKSTFQADRSISAEIMQKITQEMRQFESIFLFPTKDPHRFVARIFTVEEELDFAGHPILGAASVLHEQKNEKKLNEEWAFELRAKTIFVSTTKKEHSYMATMEQGVPDFQAPLPRTMNPKLLEALNLRENDVHEGLPLQVVSTGLPYLIVPLRGNIENARIVNPKFASMLAEVGAKFVYVLQMPQLEGRTWDNEGRVEDIATGSSAGPVGAYLIRHGIKQLGTEMIIHQGKFVGRPSQIQVKVAGTLENITSIKVSGEVCMFAKGCIDEHIV